ncbi:unnamed protein product [Penicillium salamii]|uniref:Uncharacterized protein n=1 Tax=Penicillium salamii TaxID=1612424 RepID=A0A9W4N6H3_9EURO|nr:unnamed protein product [Penicillium salamii]CAG8303853.1 unnamed protein product [Penicillium salamii]CAG8418965.1 unnamed protein product [Penicillium salamii]
MPSTDKVYVVTGANRGIGLGLTQKLLQRPNITVIASVRNTEAAASLRTETENTTVGENSTLHIIELDFSSAISPENISQVLAESTASITHIDALICNAAVIAPLTPAVSTSAEDLRASFEVNAIAPLLLFQALWPYMKKSSAPQYVAISSSVGSIAAQEPFPGGSYGASKAALNWLTRALHLQHESDGLIAFSLHPGWVQTRAGYYSVKQWDYPGEPPLTIEESVTGTLQVIDTATRENTSGKLVTYNGDVVAW